MSRFVEPPSGVNPSARPGVPVPKARTEGAGRHTLRPGAVALVWFEAGLETEHTLTGGTGNVPRAAVPKPGS